MAEDGSMVDEVMQIWSAIPALLTRASEGRICVIGSEGFTRQAVADNASILEPVIQVYGIYAA